MENSSNDTKLRMHCIKKKGHIDVVNVMSAIRKDFRFKARYVQQRIYKRFFFIDQLMINLEEVVWGLTRQFCGALNIRLLARGIKTRQGIYIVIQLTVRSRTRSKSTVRCVRFKDMSALLTGPDRPKCMSRLRERLTRLGRCPKGTFFINRFAI